MSQQMEEIRFFAERVSFEGGALFILPESGLSVGMPCFCWLLVNGAFVG